MRTCTINGQLRPITVRDRSIHIDAPSQQRADAGHPSHVAAPSHGVVAVVIADGDTVEAGQVVPTIEAMKMAAAITAPAAGLSDGAARQGRTG